MNDVSITEMGGQALLLAAKLGAPILLTALAVGLIVGMLQTATQLQEATLTFVPKFIAVGAVLLVSGNWMLSSAVTFTHELFDMLPRLLG
jgi:flagellar biosynthetic protein FliQ